jgi:tetratricopeptide (TPR) repeat protein
MSDSKASEDFGKLIKTFGEIGGYVATILAYLLAILGKGSIPYPTLVATLTFIVSVFILWRWRWPKITEMKSSIPVRKGRGQKTKPAAQSLRDLFRAGTSQLYRMPLQQRLVETTLLSLFALGALGLGVMNVPSIGEEISGFHCLSNGSDFRVVIPDFSSEGHQFENNLANIMDLQSGKRFEICRYNKQVQLTDEAQEVGRKNKANLVIWGSNSDGLINVYLTAIDWEMLSQHSSKLSSSEGQQEAAFLAENISAEILFNQGNTVEAQKSLYDALDRAEGQAWVQSNPALLAQGYFLLGLLYDPDYAPQEDADTKRAIEEYSKAIRTITEWDLNLEGAYLNRAQLYYDEDNFERAIEDYTVLINKNTEQINYVYLLRAQVHIDNGNCSQAIADLETVLSDSTFETDSLYPHVIHNLSSAYLLCGNLNAAEQTYQKMPVLNKEEVDIFSSELNDLAENSADPELKEVIISIIDHIQQLQSQ